METPAKATPRLQSAPCTETPCAEPIAEKPCIPKSARSETLSEAERSVSRIIPPKQHHLTQVGYRTTLSPEEHFRTSNQTYSEKASESPLSPNYWYGRSQSFTRAQNGITFSDTSLNTTVTRGRFVDVP
eukprot:gnl/Chilomastix_cuspidata/5531.p2 GENE.gnl/Chilomastix_cuspidata/5531~~gnl/Chilomastix_cuspidata/5531.p2  ORF type:complete len:129 (-),score=19.83 gnl/Chilomastix_cuspidata/5531:26-412(-)